MYTELDKLAYKIYSEYMMSERCIILNDIEYFIKRKDSYHDYFNEAIIKIRKEKLKELNEICTQN